MGRATFAERAGAESDDRTEATAALIDAVSSRSVHSVRVSFADQHGVLHTKTVNADRMAEVVRDGIGMPGSMLAKGTGGDYAFSLWEASGVAALDALVGARDMVLLPDPATFRVLPWLDGTGWVLCDLHTDDAVPLDLCTRTICRRSTADLAQLGYRMVAGLELELQLRDDATGEPIHPGWNLLGEGHADLVHDRLEPVRVGLAALGLPPRTVEVELGPGQVEVTFPAAAALAVADDAVLVRSAIAQLARRNGMRASFMCRPAGRDSFPSGWHLHQSLVDDAGENAFVPADGVASDGHGPGDHTSGFHGPGGLLAPVGRHWVGGLLAHAAESCLLTTPTVNGYKRYRPSSVAPDRVAWSRQHRGAMLRVVGGPGEAATRVENRAGDPSANPYLYVASQLVAGAAGLRARTEPPPPAADPYHADAGPRLPRSLGEAIDAFEAGSLFSDAWGDHVATYLATLKRSEWTRFLAAVTDWEQREYGDLF